jgi:amiloride-sensitive sodium channel
MPKVIKTITDERLIKMMLGSGTNRIVKLCWLSMIMLSFTGLIFYTYGIYKKWSISPDIGLTIRKVPSNDIPLPAITICDSIYPEQIQIEAAAMDFIVQSGSGEKLRPLTVEEQNYLAMTTHTCGPYKSAHIADYICANRSDRNLVRLMHNSRHKTGFMRCEFRELVIGSCDKVLSRSLTDHGICHTFNIQSYSQLFNKDTISEDFDVFRRSGISQFPDFESPLFNVSIDDDYDASQWTIEDGYGVNDDEVLPIRALKRNKIGVELYFTKHQARNPNMWFCRIMGRGYKLFIHAPNEVPTFLHKKQFVEYNSERSFMIDAKVFKTSLDLKGYAPEKRGCYFEGEKQLKFFKSYTKTLCDYECITNYTLQQCGCVKFSMPRTQDTPVCDVDKIECYNHAMITWPNANDASLLNDASVTCSCFESCTSIEYTVTVEKTNVMIAQALGE